MENRRNETKAKIAKKLMMNQEFLMTNQLSPKAKVWTKWHQDRFVASGIDQDRDLANAPNQKYINVSFRRSYVTLSVSVS